MVQILQFIEPAKSDNGKINTLQLTFQFEEIIETLLAEITDKSIARRSLSHSESEAVCVEYHHQGMRWLRADKFEKAKYCFSKAIRLSPTSPLMYVDLAAVFAKDNAFQRSEAALEKAHALLVGSPQRYRTILDKISMLLNTIGKLATLN